MKQFIIAGTIAFLAVMIVLTTFFPNDSLLQAFSSNDIASQIVRVVLIGMLIALLVTTPPRSRYFRAMLGGASIFLAIAAVNLVLQYAMGLLDAVLFIEVAIILAIEALETPSLGKNLRRSKPAIQN